MSWSSIVLFLASVVCVALAGDINRQSIVFYEATPDVFYCPQEKPISLEGKKKKIHLIFKLIYELGCLQLRLNYEGILLLFRSKAHFYSLALLIFLNLYTRTYINNYSIDGAISFIGIFKKGNI